MKCSPGLGEWKFSPSDIRLAQLSAIRRGIMTRMVMLGCLPILCIQTDSLYTTPANIHGHSTQCSRGSAHDCLCTSPASFSFSAVEIHSPVPTQCFRPNQAISGPEELKRLFFARQCLQSWTSSRLAVTTRQHTLYF